MRRPPSASRERPSGLPGTNHSGGSGDSTEKRATSSWAAPSCLPCSGFVQLELSSSSSRVSHGVHGASTDKRATRTMTNSILRSVCNGFAVVALLLAPSVCPSNALRAQTQLQRRAASVERPQVGAGADPNAASTTTSQTAAAIDRDLAEVTIPRLESMYSSHKYTVTQVTRWYLDRIALRRRLQSFIAH